jgi:hypothetical protein
MTRAPAASIAATAASTVPMSRPSLIFGTISNNMVKQHTDVALPALRH